MNLMRLVFSFHGRMGRAQYLYVNIALGLVLFVLGTLASVFAPDQDREPMQLSPFFVGLVIIWLLSSLSFIWMAFATSIKRLHDTDRSGWWILLGFLPVVGQIWFFVVLCFKQGTLGGNRFDVEPSVRDVEPPVKDGVTVRTTTKFLLTILGVVLVLSVAVYFNKFKIHEPSQKEYVARQPEVENARQQISEPRVSGSLHGQPFRMDRAEFSMELNRLTLRQGEDFFPERAVKIGLKAEEALPHGKTYIRKKDEGTFDTTVDVSIIYTPPGQNYPEYNFLMSTPVELHLEFGQLKGDQLSGKINMRAHDEFKSYATGSFIATVTEHEGTLKPSNMATDVTDHAFSVMKYLARGYLKEQYPEASIEVLEFIKGAIRGSGKQRESEVLVVFKLSHDEIRNLRFQFGKKESGEWHVVNVLRGDQLPPAHPLKKDNEESSELSRAKQQCIYLAAVRVEDEVQKLYPGEYIKSGGPDLFHPWGRAEANTKFGRAQSHVVVELESGQKIDRRFYCEKQEGTWVLAKELNANEDMNLATGEIEKR